MNSPPVSVGSLRGILDPEHTWRTLDAIPVIRSRETPRGGIDMAVIEPISPGLAPVAIPEVDERAARRTLRDQISRLDRELSALCLDACPRIDPGPPLRSLAGPRVLSLGELECVRDE